MIIDNPTNIEPLRRLWKQAFGDTDTFLDSFFTFGFSPNRCRQITADGNVAAALYWFDCSFSGQKIAYLYAVATDRAYRGRGLCRMLMEDTHRYLRSLGYAGALLVPVSNDLFQLYEKLGYQTCSSVNEFTCKASGTVPLRLITAEEYDALRKEYLPAGSVEPEGAMLTFLREQYFFYAGKDFILCATSEGDTLIVAELLGDPSAATGIVSVMGKQHGRFRTPGNGKPFAMYHPLIYSPDKPSYFALALD